MVFFKHAKQAGTYIGGSAHVASQLTKNLLLLDGYHGDIHGIYSAVQVIWEKHGTVWMCLTMLRIVCACNHLQTSHHCSFLSCSHILQVVALKRKLRA